MRSTLEMMASPGRALPRKCLQLAGWTRELSELEAALENWLDL